MSPNSVTPTEDIDSNFELIASIKANGVVPVHKYKSKVTGLTIYIAEIEGPMVNGHFFVGTEAHDDDGIPHTLEHVIFTGSKKYPYRKLLQFLSNKCLAYEINAWTANDHTCFWMETAGSEGFFALLPIYIEHILNPTLTDSAFMTEVHHITEKGEDAGVVYCEMQGRENTGENRTYMAMLRNIYPGHCGFKSETGGALKNLRESTTNIKIHSFHKKFYRPENLTLYIAGQVTPDEVLDVISTIEKDVISKENYEPFVEPWQSPVPPLVESADLEVKYPCDQEDNGMVYIGWRGPKDQYRLGCCGLLLSYLTDTTASPLPQKFVEIENPYASDVSYSQFECTEPMNNLYFVNVPISKIGLVKEYLLQVLEDISNGKIELDLNRIRTILHKWYLGWLSALENSADYLLSAIIMHTLYGKSNDDLQSRLSFDDIEKMKTEPKNFWLNLLKEYFLDSPNVTVRGYPSLEEKTTIDENEKKRIELQKEKLGIKGLTKLGEELQNAIAQNKKSPPKELLSLVSTPSISSLNLFTGKFYTTDSVEQHPLFDLLQVPVQMHLDDVKTNFVNITVLLNTSELPEDLRPYHLLFVDSLLELPVKRGDEIVPYEEVTNQLEIDTMSIGSSSGINGYTTTATLSMELEPIKYERGIIWIRELLYQTEITPERLHIIATKYINSAAENKRDGCTVLSETMNAILFKRSSNYCTSSTLKQLKFMNAVIEKLDSNEGNEVLEKMETVRHIITKPSNIVIHMSTNVTKLADKVGDLMQPWKQLLPQNEVPVHNKLMVTPDWKLLIPPSEQTNNSCVVGLGSIESSYLSHTTPCITDHNDKDLASLLFYLRYFAIHEGPLSNEIRGAGLAYGFGVDPSVSKGLLYFTLYRATNCISAFKEAKKILLSPATSEMKWDESLFELARNDLIAAVINSQKNVSGVMSNSIMSYFTGLDHDHNRKLLKIYSELNKDDVTHICEKYIVPLFDPLRSKTAIVCHPSKTEEIANAFKEMGYELDIYQSLEESFLSML